MTFQTRDTFQHDGVLYRPVANFRELGKGDLASRCRLGTTPDLFLREDG